LDLVKVLLALEKELILLDREALVDIVSVEKIGIGSNVTSQ